MGQVKRHLIALVLDVAEPGVTQDPTGYQHIPDRSTGIHNDDKPYGGQASGWDEAHDYQASQADDQQLIAEAHFRPVYDQPDLLDILGLS